MTYNTIKPLVSVVTPMYNAERYVRECIESVLKQTYDNWEYLIVDNCSTDRSRAIAEEYASKDKRIRIHENASFLTVMQNHNHALRLISKESKYCKVVHADDWLFPECLERMVGLADAYDTVGIVGSYRLDGEQVGLDGLPYTKQVIPGTELCRAVLLGEFFVFGSPTSLLMRSQIIREGMPFYNEAHIFGDVEACFQVLQKWDFGFVHQVLTYSRRHTQTASRALSSHQTPALTPIYMMKKFGRRYLNGREYAIRLQQMIDEYYRVVAMALLQGRRKAFWSHQRKALGELGVRFSIFALVRAIIVAALRPVKIVSQVISEKHGSGTRV